MTIVLDTNVVVSALLRPGNPPARVLDLVIARQVTLALDARIFAEYRDVLYRPELAFSDEHVTDLLDFLWSASDRVLPPPLQLSMPDSDDAMFIEVAVAAGASALVTGNLRHFPGNVRCGVAVLSPRQWIEAWIAQSEG